MAGDYNGNGAQQDEIKGFFETFNAANGTLAGTTHVTPVSAKSYADVFTQIRNSGATSLFAFYTGGNAVDFVKQAASFNFGASGFHVYSPGVLTEGPLLKQQGTAANGVFTAMNYSPQLGQSAKHRVRLRRLLVRRGHGHRQGDRGRRHGPDRAGAQRGARPAWPDRQPARGLAVH